MTDLHDEDGEPEWATWTPDAVNPHAWVEPVADGGPAATSHGRESVRGGRRPLGGQGAGAFSWNVAAAPPARALPASGMLLVFAAFVTSSWTRGMLVRWPPGRRPSRAPSPGTCGGRAGRGARRRCDGARRVGRCVARASAPFRARAGSVPQRPPVATAQNRCHHAREAITHALKVARTVASLASSPAGAHSFDSRGAACAQRPQELGQGWPRPPWIP